MSLAVSGRISLAVFAVGFFIFLVRRKKNDTLASRNGIWYFILLTFIALVILLFPIVRVQYMDDAGGAVFQFILTLGQTIQNALRTFILDGSWSDWKGVREIAKYPFYSLYGIALSIFAPLLTFSMIFSLLSAQVFRFQLWSAQILRRPLFIMSELSEASLVLAKSILQDPEISRPKIIFTDVFAEEEEESYELRQKARKIGAAFYKDDITAIRLHKKRGDVSFFMIGRDESENIEQALKVYQVQKNSWHVRIFVWSKEDANAVLLDSLKRGGILDYAKDEPEQTFNKNAGDKPEKSGTKDGTNAGEEKAGEVGKQYAYFRKSVEGVSGGCIKDNKELLDTVNDALAKGKFVLMRRIDNALNLAWQTVPEMHILSRAVKAKEPPAVLLIGRGHYAEAFFKTLLWFCQAEDFCPAVTVIDRTCGEDAGGQTVEQSIRERCPELLQMNRCTEDGEAHYDCAFFSWDAFTGAGDPACGEAGKQLFPRLKKIKTVIISTGDDDSSIACALYCRTLFERLHLHEEMPAERPEIFAVVHDDRKAMKDPKETGRADRIFRGLRTYDNRPLEIQFIGNNTFLYDMSVVYDQAEESRGWEYHNQWVDIMRESPGQDEDECNYQEAKNRCQYEEKEYFRLSSISRAIHSRALDALGLYQCEKHYGRADRDIRNCQCPSCRRRRKVEHMRWNAFMRSMGYVYGPKNTIAKTHHDLIAYGNLEAGEEKKDS